MAVNTKVKELIKKGIDVINLSLGDPTFPVFKKIRAAGIKAIKEDFSKYTPVEGIEELREIIAKKLKRENKLRYEKDEIIVSCGAKHSIFNLLLALLSPGDEVIVFVPYWVSYPEMIRLAEGKPVFVKTDENFHLIPGEIKKAVSRKTPTSFAALRRAIRAS